MTRASCSISRTSAWPQRHSMQHTQASPGCSSPRISPTLLASAYPPCLSASSSRPWCSAACWACQAVESCTNAAAKMQYCGLPAAILSVLQELVQQFDQHRCRNKRLRSCLNPIVNVLYGLAFPLMDIIASLKVCRRRLNPQKSPRLVSTFAVSETYCGTTH